MAVLLRNKLTPLAAAAGIAVGIIALPSGVRAAAPDASPAIQARSSADSARQHWNTANDLLQQIHQQELENQQTMANLRRLAYALHARTSAIHSLKQADPAKALKQFDQRIAAINGSDSHATWSPSKGISLPTKAALEKKINELKASIAKLESQVKSLTVQKDQLNSKADQLTAKSNKEQGRQSVDDYKTASNLRKQAADVQRKIDQTNAALTPLQQDLALAVTEHKTVTTAISQLEQQRAALAAQWDELKKQIATQEKSSRALFQSADAKNNDAITAQLATLNKGLAAAEKLRQQAEEAFQQAASQFGMAANQAQLLQNSLRTNTANGLEQAQQTLEAVIDPQTNNLQKAAVQSAIAQLKADEAQALQQQAELAGFLTPILKKAGIAAPKGLPEAAQLKKKVAEARKAADQAFVEADRQLKQLTGASVRQNAAVLHILTLYQWSRFEADAGRDKQAAAHLKAAKVLAANAAKNDAELPNLPPEIAPAPATQPTQPA